MWEGQFLFALRGAQVVHCLDPSIQPPKKFIIAKDEKKLDVAAKTSDKPPVLNPEFEQWEAKDQQVLGYLLTSLSREIGSQVTNMTTAAGAWASIKTLHTSQ